MKKDTQEKVGAVITAAGSSKRMGGIDKIFALLDGQPLLTQVIDVCQRCDSIDQIVVVLSPPNLGRGQQLVAEHKWSKVSDVCPGGQRRQDSVMNGLNRLNHCHWVVIHDGARPLVTTEIIEHGLTAAAETGAAVAAIPVTETIKIADRSQLVRKTLERQHLWMIQTPQVFKFTIIEKAYHSGFSQNDVTDDAELVEQSGYNVKLYMGSYDNIKITTPNDLTLAEILRGDNEG